MINQIHNENCLETMKRMPDHFIDLTVTSPPYDNLRDYKGYSFDFESIARELYRVTKKGGVVVWIVNDQTVNGSESGSSFKQALFFKEIGFNLHDTMIWEKDSISFPETVRYSQIFEFMFVFSKGKPKTFNCIKDRKNIHYNGRKHIKGSYRTSTSGERFRHNKENALKPFSSRFNIWRVGVGFGKSSKYKPAFQHPAIFPEQLAIDHILSWSNKDDIVYDPMGGAGTTHAMSEKLGRRAISSEISKEYCDIAKERIRIERSQMKLF